MAIHTIKQNKTN